MTEFLWGYSKRLFRANNDYSGNIERMREVVPRYLAACPLSTIRRWHRRMWKLLDLYVQGVSGPLAQYILRKYRGHRVIPKFVDAQLDELAKEMNGKMI